MSLDQGSQLDLACRAFVGFVALASFAVVAGASLPAAAAAVAEVVPPSVDCQQLELAPSRSAASLCSVPVDAVYL